MHVFDASCVHQQHQRRAHKTAALCTSQCDFAGRNRPLGMLCYRQYMKTKRIPINWHVKCTCTEYCSKVQLNWYGNQRYRHHFPPTTLTSQLVFVDLLMSGACRNWHIHTIIMLFSLWLLLMSTAIKLVRQASFQKVFVGNTRKLCVVNPLSHTHRRMRALRKRPESSIPGTSESNLIRITWNSIYCVFSQTESKMLNLHSSAWSEWETENCPDILIFV